MRVGYEETIIPSQVANKPNIMLKAIYRKDIKTSPFIPRDSDSKEKVEKVVNPPQKPTISNAFNFGCKRPDF